MKIIKKSSFCFLMVVIVFSMSLPVFADIYYSEYQKNIEGNLIGVWDNADILTSNEESKLYDLAQDYAAKCDISVLFMTVSDAKGKSTEKYSDDFYDHLLYDSGVQYNTSQNNKWKNDNPGILFVIDMDNRMSYINTSADVIDWFSDREIDSCLTAGDSYLGRGDYYTALVKIADESISNIYHWKYEDTRSNNSSSSVSSVRFRINWFLSLVIGLVVALFTGTRSYIKENKANVPVSSNVYVKSNEFKVLNREERYLRTYETVDRDYYKPKSSDSSSHSSGSSHHSSGGHSHGGGGHHF